jgi:FlaA1/EpsC-like NDP-sugar epimerase
VTRVRNRHLLALDLVLFPTCVLVAFALRFETFQFSADVWAIARWYVALGTAVKVIVLLAFGLHRRLWRHASLPELERLLGACLTSGAINAIVGAIVLPELGTVPGRVPLSVLAIDALLTSVAIVIPRLGVRAITRIDRRRRRRIDVATIVVGAGQAGQIAVRELLSNPQLELYPVGFLDDDPTKQRHVVGGLPVFGVVAELPRVVRGLGIREVVIAMPAAPGSTIRQIVRMARDLGVKTRTVPGLYEILSGRVGVSNLRNVEIQDLLRRAPIETDLGAVREIAAERVVLVTGGGGSIGSELCRQLARLGPAELLVLGHGENSIFEICQELATVQPHVRVTPIIADIRDAARIRAIVQRRRPAAVFHAAAHKHVPLMEANVIEAVTNNVLGTRNVLAACEAAGTAHFVLISSDKAVRPTSVMGATKRIAEQLVQSSAARHGRPYVGVRFGNVLGSRGSVIPTFLQQIKNGGPVTVTHPDMTRYFITIQEAVQLVLQASAMGAGGEIFVLDMGEPVRILDLATDVITLSGLEVGTDVEIAITGIRPGEKLAEEVFFRGEEVLPTPHPKLLRARLVEVVPRIDDRVDDLIAATAEGAGDAEIRGALRELVPQYGSAAAHMPVVVEPSGRADHRSAARRGLTPRTGDPSSVESPL